MSTHTSSASTGQHHSEGQERACVAQEGHAREVNSVPYTGIDTEAKRGKSRTKGWIFGYKLHLSCSTGSLIIPLSAEFTTANVQDNQVYGREDNLVSERSQVRGR